MPENRDDTQERRRIWDAVAEKVLSSLLLVAAAKECSVETAAKEWMDKLIAKREREEAHE